MSNGLKRRDMRPIQKWGVDRVYDHAATILAWDMGAGKTVTVLTAMDDLLEDRVVRRVLIVAPLLVASATFPDEFEEWSHLSHIDWTLIRAEDEDEDIVAARQKAYRMARDLIGLEPAEAAKFANRHKSRAKEWKRRRLVGIKSEVHIINKEALNWLWEYYGQGKRWPYDMLVVDEASIFKNGRRRTKLKELSRFGVMAKARKYAKRIVLMTGTPAPKGLRNLWGLSYIADGGERLGTSRSKFEQLYFEKDFMGWNLEPRPHAKRDIMEKMSDIMFSLAPEDYPQTPGATFIPRYVDLPRKVIDEYRRFERTLVSEAYDVEAVNSGVLAGKLMQFANGSMYNEDRKDVWIHDKKLEMLESIVEEADDEPVLIGYNFKFDLARILKRYPKAVVFGKGGDVRDQKARWNAGKIDMLLAHPQAVGHGQNIQRGGNIMVWYGLTPDLELYQQFNKRLDRPGQERKVANYHIIARQTYDEDIIPLLKSRESDQNDIMRSVVFRLTGEKRRR